MWVVLFDLLSSQAMYLYFAFPSEWSGLLWEQTACKSHWLTTPKVYFSSCALCPHLELAGVCSTVSFTPELLLKRHSMAGVLSIMVAEGNSHGGPLKALFGTDTYHCCPRFIGQSKLCGHSRAQQSNCVSCLHREGYGRDQKLARNIFPKWSCNRFW